MIVERLMTERMQRQSSPELPTIGPTMIVETLTEISFRPLHHYTV